MSAESQPIRPDELEGLFAPCGLAIGRACALAVSGGSDSTALMVLFADWLRQRGMDAGAHAVLTVDHGLRTGSAAEARAVSEQAAALGFQRAILAWDGPKPQAGIQAAAREARYRLMSACIATRGMTTLLTAHTRDDQAETLLMRLARGSGLDGLAAIAPWVEARPGGEIGALQIVRPLLGIAKARLRATLEQRGVGWIEDPSNQSPAFERTRWRAARSHLDALGLSDEMLASSARRLSRARTALEAAADDLCAENAGLVHTDPIGLFRIDRARLRRVPEEIALRVIGRCIAAAGGLGEPVSLAKLEPVVAGIWHGVGAGSWTLARAQIAAAADVVQIEREPGRLPLPVMILAGPARALWDGRFVIEIADGMEGSLEVRAVGEAGFAQLRRTGRATGAKSALLLAPSFWREKELLAVPAVDFWAREGLDRLMTARFVGLRYNSRSGGGMHSAAPDTR